jgi:AcrR family transcriptional regulator
MTPTGLRERKKRETRQRLRAGALQLVADRGLDHVTVDDIADAAGVSTRTFFNYFSSKEEAVAGSEPEWMAHIAEVLAARPAGEAPLFSLQAVFEEFAALLVQDREALVMRRKVMADNPSLMPRRTAAFDELERVLVTGIRERTPIGATSHADAALVVAAAVAAMKVSVDQWVDSEGDADLTALLHRAINRLALGFGPASARPVAPTRGSARRTIRKDLR